MHVVVCVCGLRCVPECVLCVCVCVCVCKCGSRQVHCSFMFSCKVAFGLFTTMCVQEDTMLSIITLSMFAIIMISTVTETAVRL